jgi:thiazole synthase
MKNDKIVIANKKFNSRLIVGTGKYKSMSECAKAIKLSGAEIVTVAVRRVNITDKKKPLLMDHIDPKKITYLPNTAGCFTSEEALRTLRLAREIGGWKLVKLEVLGDKQNLFPDMIETLKSTEVLAKEGFKVMVYCNDDPLMAKRLENSGAVSIMPMAAPIGSGLGIQNKVNIKIIRAQTKLPLIIDAGLGQASDATIAMELGCDGVLVNTAIAKAKKPFEMALAFKGFFALAIAVLTSTPSHPSSIAIVASDAWPRPASIIKGSLVCALIIFILTLFWMPNPEPMGAAIGIIDTAPEFSNRFAINGSSLQ